MENREKCFVIMPISDPDGYEKGHFKYVYEDVFKPAIENAGFYPKRADDDGSSSLIQVNIIRDIIEAPMAICDLSSRNPNVLFELGIRQAFDLPVVLVQEEGTPRIFDISTINTIDYRSALIYREVIEDREKISKAIKATKDNTSGVNSIIRLLEIGKAEMDNEKSTSELDDIKMMFFALSNQINNLRKQNENLNNSSFLINTTEADMIREFTRRCNDYKNIIEDKASRHSLCNVLQKCSNDIKVIENEDRLSNLQKEFFINRLNEIVSMAQEKLLNDN